MTAKELRKLVETYIYESSMEQTAFLDFKARYSSEKKALEEWPYGESPEPPRLSIAEMPRSVRPYAHAALDFDRAKRFMYELFPIGEMEEYTKDEVVFKRCMDRTLLKMRYSIEGVTPEGAWDVVVYAREFLEAWEESWETIEKGHKERRRAEKPSTVLTIIGDTQIDITYKKYQFAMTTKPNDVAYIAVLPASFFLKAKWNKDGSLKDELPIEQGAESDLDLPLVKQIFTAAYAAKVSATQYTITVYLPEFCAQMGINFVVTDTDKDMKTNDVFSKIEVFDKCAGIVGGGQKIFKLLSVVAYDREKKLLTLAVPYMNYILEQVQADMKQDKTYKKKLAAGSTPPAVIPGYYSWLAHSDIVNEKNKVAVEIAYRIIAGLMQMGTRTDRPFTVKYQTIIDDVPTLKKRLEGAATKNKNVILSRAFSGAYKILRTKTDVYKYFLNLHITETIPTSSTLQNNIVITHKGRNKEFSGTIPKAKQPE